MLDIEEKALAVATQIEIRVPPSMEFGGSAECPAAAFMSGGLAGVMDEGDGGVVIALQRAQIGKDRCDLTGDILIA
jgi:hypothetical protein